MKRSVDDLALFGGEPLFEHFRPTGQLSLPNTATFFEHARAVFKARRLTNNGPLVRALESRLAALHEVTHCISFCNASVAIVQLLRLLAGDLGGEILLPGFSYRGLPHLVQWAGFLPAFCDADPQTHTMSPESADKAVNSRTRAILAVHHVNSPCRVEALTIVAQQHGVPIFFDAVYGMMQTLGGRPVGGFGAAEVFSLHATKLLNGFEGGYVTTNDTGLAEKLRSARSFGFQGPGNVVRLGLNGKLNEIHAALALAALDSVNGVLAANQVRHTAYQRFFRSIPGLRLLEFAPGERHNYELVLLEVQEDWLLGRDDTCRLLCAENALARPYYSPPLHRSEHCPEGCGDVSLPVTEALAQRFIQMPVGDLVSENDIEALAEFMAFVHDNGPAIAARINCMGKTA